MLRRKTRKTVITGSPKRPRKSGPVDAESPPSARVKRGEREGAANDNDDGEVELIETKEYDFVHLSREELDDLWHRLAIITLHFQPTETWYASLFEGKKTNPATL
jgi:hypothetical protein